MKKNVFEFKEWLKTVPVIESHEHYLGETKSHANVFELILNNYLITDMMVANGGKNVIDDLEQIEDFDQKCLHFLKIYKTVMHTSYGHAARFALLNAYDADITTIEGIKKVQELQTIRNKDFHDKLIKEANIVAGICDVNFNYKLDREFADWCRFAISVPSWHMIDSYAYLEKINSESFDNYKINSLDDYIAAMDNRIKLDVATGYFKTIKDQSAYRRDIAYKNPTKECAENIFNKIINDKELILSETDTRILDDYVFHRIVDLSVKHNLPMQIHTGHMAGGYNNVIKTNAGLLTELIGLHLDATFDLFHGNYPYMGDFLYLGKNYPNVYLDLCWCHSIDRDYSIELMRRMVLTSPTSQVLAFGGDTHLVEHQVAYLDQAREHVACAMCSLIDDGLLTEIEAKQIAIDWFFNNPNKLFKLGFEEINI